MGTLPCCLGMDSLFSFFFFLFIFLLKHGQECSHLPAGGDGTGFFKLFFLAVMPLLLLCLGLGAVL